MRVRTGSLSDVPVAPGRPRSPVRTMVTICVPMFLVLLDVNIVHVALPRIGASFDVLPGTWAAVVDFLHDPAGGHIAHRRTLDGPSRLSGDAHRGRKRVPGGIDRLLPCAVVERPAGRTRPPGARGGGHVAGQPRRADLSVGRGRRTRQGP